MVQMVVVVVVVATVVGITVVIEARAVCDLVVLVFVIVSCWGCCWLLLLARLPPQLLWPTSTP